MPTHYPGRAKEIRALNAYIPFLRAAETLATSLGGRLEAQGLTLTQFGALEALLHLGPMCQRELARKLLRSGGNLTLVVDNLERQGWVRRERDAEDRRRVTVRLTPSGRRRVSKVLPGHVAAIAELMDRLTAAEQEQLRHLCRKLGRGTLREKCLQEGGSHDRNSRRRGTRADQGRLAR